MRRLWSDFGRGLMHEEVPPKWLGDGLIYRVLEMRMEGED